MPCLSWNCCVCWLNVIIFAHISFFFFLITDKTGKVISAKFFDMWEGGRKKHSRAFVNVLALSKDILNIYPAL